MKKNLFLSTGIFISVFSFAQNQIVNPDQNKKLGSNNSSAPLTIQCKGFVNPPTADLKWRPILSTEFKESEPQAKNQELIDQIKSEKIILKEQQNQENKISQSEPSTQFVTPVVGTNYLGNTNSGYSPLDNSMAISDAGFIVSVANGTMEIDNMTGTNLYYNNLLTMVNAVDNSISGVCDPVVLYDSGNDRFICFCQSTPISVTNKILIFFSKTSDPTNGWWLYELNGDPTGNGDGFDYPKLAVSTDELFVTGNLFSTSTGLFDQAIIFQIDKLAGYAGGSLTFLDYHNLNGSPFTLLPVSYGQNGNYGPGIFLVSTDNSGGASINLYQITNDISNSPTINYWSVATTPYSVAPDANQLGTSCKLNCGDCRTLSGFYLQNAGVGTIHFVFHSDIGSGWHGINYNRLVVNTLTNTSSTYGLSGSYDYCYPSVVSYSTSPSDNSVMIGFGRSGPSVYPEVRVVNCDNGMNWSGSTLVKASSTYVSYTSTTDERWGDYTGTTRFHPNTDPSIWMSGMFGNSSHEWDTWIAEIHDPASGINTQTVSENFSVYPNPIIDLFTVEFDMPSSENIDVAVYDMNGKMVKDLFTGKANAGTNKFSFNKANLSAGTYFITIKSPSNTIKNEKIIIAQ